MVGVGVGRGGPIWRPSLQRVERRSKESVRAFEMKRQQLPPSGVHHAVKLLISRYRHTQAPTPTTQINGSLLTERDASLLVRLTDIHTPLHFNPSLLDYPKFPHPLPPSPTDIWPDYYCVFRQLE